jgi:hypothetical protein
MCSRSRPSWMPSSSTTASAPSCRSAPHWPWVQGLVNPVDACRACVTASRQQHCPGVVGVLVCCCATLAVPALLPCLHRVPRARSRGWLCRPQEGAGAAAAGLPALGGGACELLLLAGLTPTAADTTLWCAHMHVMTCLQRRLPHDRQGSHGICVSTSASDMGAAVQCGVCAVMHCCSSNVTAFLQVAGAAAGNSGSRRFGRRFSSAVAGTQAGADAEPAALGGVDGVAGGAERTKLPLCLSSDELPPLPEMHVKSECEAMKRRVPLTGPPAAARTAAAGAAGGGRR